MAARLDFPKFYWMNDSRSVSEMSHFAGLRRTETRFSVSLWRDDVIARSGRNEMRLQNVALFLWAS